MQREMMKLQESHIGKNETSSGPETILSYM